MTVLYEIRTYTCKPGTMSEQLDIYRQYGLEPQARLLGQPLLYATTEVGPLESYTHIWMYDDLADRQRKRAAMYRDEQFQEYRRRFVGSGNIRALENRLLNGVPFIPTRITD
jgi:hypothetical protein